MGETGVGVPRVLLLRPARKSRVGSIPTSPAISFSIVEGSCVRRHGVAPSHRCCSIAKAFGGPSNRRRHNACLGGGIAFFPPGVVVAKEERVSATGELKLAKPDEEMSSGGRGQNRLIGKREFNIRR